MCNYVRPIAGAGALALRGYVASGKRIAPNDALRNRALIPVADIALER